MILIDFRQVANLIFYSGFNDVGYAQDPFKHRFLNYLLTTKGRFKNKYGDLVIALDSANYWRRQVFPQYKASRAKGREDSDLDWTKIFENFKSMENDLRNHIPWKVVAAPTAEADDIIGVLAARYHRNENILIVSADKDFLQLQKYPNVSQYSPMMKKILVEANPEISLREKIIRGDAGDGIPTIHCKDDKFTSEIKTRAKSIKKEWIEMVLRTPNIEEVLTKKEMVGYKRNQKLIDFSFIPKDVSQNIIDSYTSCVPAKKSGVFSYLNEKNYTNLIDMLELF